MKLFIIALATVFAAEGAPSYNGLSAFRGHSSGMIPMGELGRIVGGTQATIEDFPYMVSLQHYGSHICGASIISSTKILTAAHCTDGATILALSIRVGSTYRGSGGVVRPVLLVAQHTSYNPTTIDFDISVIKLLLSLQFGSKIFPIALPAQGSTTSAGALATVSGWGTLYSGGPLPTALLYVKVPVVSNSDCNTAYHSITNRMICAGWSFGGEDTCQGDSGGPLVYENKQIGIVSWGNGCAQPDWPGVYTNVAYFTNWINQQ